MFDANTIVSAALTPHGMPLRAMARARGIGGFALSLEVHDEIAAVLGRPKFAKILSADRREEILEWLAAAAFWFDPQERVTDCRDAKDNRYLALALAAGATAIVSGDADLLILHPWRNIPILRPATFVAEHIR